MSALSTPRNTYYSTVRLAPGGRQLAVTVRNLTEVGLWVCDLARGALTPVLRRGEVYAANWTPDGERLVFSWLEGGRSSLAWQRVDGITPEPLGPAEHFDTLSSWTPDGRQFVGVRYLADNWDLTVVKVENGRATAQALTTTPANELSPEVSPDGRWLAFESDDSGRHEVYVQPFPGPGPRTRVSIEGGLSPAWATNGRELFFASLRAASGKQRMMVVSFTHGTPARVGAARPLFEFDNSRLGFAGEPVRHYDVAPDGQRFFVVQRQPPPPTVPVTHLNIVQNWFVELKAKVQPTR